MLLSRQTLTQRSFVIISNLDNANQKSFVIANILSYRFPFGGLAR